jgi:hypothetical protein
MPIHARFSMSWTWADQGANLFVADGLNAFFLRDYRLAACDVALVPFLVVAGNSTRHEFIEIGATIAKGTHACQLPVMSTECG